MSVPKADLGGLSEKDSGLKIELSNSLANSINPQKHLTNSISSFKKHTKFLIESEPPSKMQTSRPKLANQSQNTMIDSFMEYLRPSKSVKSVKRVDLIAKISKKPFKNASGLSVNLPYINSQRGNHSLKSSAPNIETKLAKKKTTKSPETRLPHHRDF